VWDALGAIPRLSGARCRGRSDIFDEYDDPDIIEYAVNRCHGCPALAACSEWLDGLPRRQRPTGVIAGQLIAPPQATQQPGLFTLNTLRRGQRP
jgi:hypothetical protein